MNNVPDHWSDFDKHVTTKCLLFYYKNDLCENKNYSTETDCENGRRSGRMHAYV